jgi:hypothetical protein
MHDTINLDRAHLFYSQIFPAFLDCLSHGDVDLERNNNRGIICHLKVVRTDGRPMDLGVSLVRSLSAAFSAVALCLGFFWAGWTSTRQSGHDLIADTVIVRVPRSISLI